MCLGCGSFNTVVETFKLHAPNLCLARMQDRDRPFEFIRAGPVVASLLVSGTKSVCHRGTSYLLLVGLLRDLVSTTKGYVCAWRDDAIAMKLQLNLRAVDVLTCCTVSSHFRSCIGARTRTYYEGFIRSFARHCCC